LQESTITSKGQTTLPKNIREALHLQPGDKLRYLLADGEVRLIRVRAARELAGMLKRSGQKPISLEEMDEAIAKGAADQDE
jgi:antitoxin PrlF